MQSGANSKKSEGVMRSVIPRGRLYKTYESPYLSCKAASVVSVGPDLDSLPEWQEMDVVVCSLKRAFHHNRIRNTYRGEQDFKVREQSDALSISSAGGNARGCW
jgi:hypothetical protein